MGHYCRVCGRVRSNESFSGKGHRTHICGKCKRMPKAQRDGILQTEEIADFMWQSNISARNIARLQQLAQSPIAAVRQLAGVVIEVAQVHPRKRKRIGFLAKNHPALLARLAELHLVEEHVLWPSWEDPFDEVPWPDAESVAEPDTEPPATPYFDDEIPF